MTVIFSNLFQDLLSKNIENKSATNQPAVMFAVNVTWYRCVQRYPVARYTNGTRTQGCQVMFTAKITANHIPKYKRPISFLSFLMDLFSRFWEVRIMIFGYFGSSEAHFGGPEAHSGGPGAHFEISGINVILGGAPARITIPI